MRGMKLASSLIVVLSVLSADVYAQTCEWPDDEDLQERYIIIEGDTYEYVDLETSRQRLKKIKELEAVERKLIEKDNIIENQKQLISNKQSQIDLYQQAWNQEKELVGDLIDSGFPKEEKVPFFQRPAVNFIGGVLVTGALYFSWQVAQNGGLLVNQ